MRDAPNVDALRSAAIEMSRRGLTDRDIGAALHVDPAAVRRLLAPEEPDAAALHAAAWSGRPRPHQPVTWRR